MGDLVSMRVSMSASLAVFFCCCSLLFVGSVAWPSDETLIRMTEEFWLNSSGWYSPFRNETFAPDFVFRGPDIGPLNYNDNYRTLSGNGENSSSPYHAFPDITPNSRSCWLAPEDNAFGRHVFCVHYPTGTHTRDWHFIRYFSFFQALFSGSNAQDWRSISRRNASIDSR